MEETLASIGILAVLSLIVYIYKKILEWHAYSRSSIYEDENVYRAADEFIHGASIDAVKAVLSGCLILMRSTRKKSSLYPFPIDPTGMEVIGRLYGQ